MTQAEADAIHMAPAVDNLWNEFIRKALSDGSIQGATLCHPWFGYIEVDTDAGELGMQVHFVHPDEYDERNAA